MTFEPIPEREPGEELPTLLTQHVVVPAAVIAMVASLLFYLVDVRSAFYGGGAALQWIGFCFVSATVLIERYRRSTGDEAHQEAYTVLLALATVLVLWVTPWETREVGWAERITNLLIVAAVWLFATRVTRGLSPELGRPAPRPRLYGLELLRMEEWLREKEAETGAVSAAKLRQASSSEAVSANPAAAVARLALAALFAFALGEPVLLKAAPQTGLRALAAVMVFLLATGVVLAAGSALDGLRRAEREGGQAAPGQVVGRVAFAGLLVALVLTAALGAPGISFRGTGVLRPPVAHGEGSDADRGYQEGDDVTRLSETPPPDRPGTDPSSEQGRAAGDGRRRSSLTAAGSLPHFLGGLAALGKWLLIPLALGVLGAVGWVLARLRPQLGNWRGRIADRLRALLAGLAGLFGRFWPARRRPGERGPDPLDDLEELDDLPPREAVLAAYLRFLALLDRLGHPRPEKATPYEVLNALSADLRRLEDPARTLTELYVHAAYAAEPVEPVARARAIFVLRGMKGLLKDAAA